MFFDNFEWVNNTQDSAWDFSCFFWWVWAIDCWQVISLVLSSWENWEVDAVCYISELLSIEITALRDDEKDRNLSRNCRFNKLHQEHEIVSLHCTACS